MKESLCFWIIYLKSGLISGVINMTVLRALGGFTFVVYFIFMLYLFYLFHTLAMSNKRIAEALERIMKNISGKTGE